MLMLVLLSVKSDANGTFLNGCKMGLPAQTALQTKDSRWPALNSFHQEVGFVSLPQNLPNVLVFTSKPCGKLNPSHE